MPFESVDKLQKALAEGVFHYAKDSKKAAGRALGTLVEIITFYLLQSWGFGASIAIERALPEYGNPDITHNVEYSLHPVLRKQAVVIENPGFPMTASKLLKHLHQTTHDASTFKPSNNALLSKANVLRNSCAIAKGKDSYLMAMMDHAQTTHSTLALAIIEQYSTPFAMFECKRVGVEDGMKKGPQSIEKAKQGAYVAKSVSALHKVRTSSGDLLGVIYRKNGEHYSKPYKEMIAEIISTDDAELLCDFILTVGVVSNHGNWFTSENHNKELKVLAQSYDWLLFLSDEGLSTFISELLLDPKPLLAPARTAFLASYATGKKKNLFTKVQMESQADRVLRDYFSTNRNKIEKWFNVISPNGWTMGELQRQLRKLRGKNWPQIHAP